MVLSITMHDLPLDRLAEIMEQIQTHPFKTVGYAAAGLALYQVAKVFKMLFIDPHRSPLRKLKGPDTYQSIMAGNQPLVYSKDVGLVHEEWIREYGNVVAYWSIFKVSGRTRPLQNWH